MILATTTSVTIPLEIAFEPGFSTSISFEVFSLFVDFLFLVDILINFRCSFINNHGDEITDRKVIAKKYVMGRFWLDFMTILPAKHFILDPKYNMYAKMIGMLKVTRVLRISDLISYLNIHETVKMNLKLIQQIFFLMLYVHCIACGWFYITK
jgi:hypothetical protein